MSEPMCPIEAKRCVCKRTPEEKKKWGNHWYYCPAYLGPDENGEYTAVVE